jgi:hypothetical protein
VPRPFARVNLEVLVPEDLGPKVGDINPLGGWVMSFVYNWQAGVYETWAGGGFIPQVVNNIQWRDFWNLDLRLNKTIRFNNNRSRLNLFVDVNNLLNHRYFQPFAPGFVLANDRVNYLRSLHLPQDILDEISNGYPAPPIPGNDRPGDYRDFDVEFVPIVSVQDLNSVANPSTRPLYWDAQTASYFQYQSESGEFVPADQDFVDQVLDDKAYIDMPNMPFFTFFNPRAVRFGFRITF